MTDRRPQLLFVDADRSPGIEGLTDRIVPWVLHCHRSYLKRLLQGFDTPKTLSRWLLNPDSELALQKMRLLICDDRIAGGYIGFAGRQLRRRRETDLVDLVRTSGERPTQALRSRLRELLALFAPVAPNDFYVSKLGLSPGFEDSQLLRPLVDDCVQRARQWGFDRIRIDVDEGHRGARDVYDAAGFQVIDHRKTRDSAISHLNLVTSL